LLSLLLPLLPQPLLLAAAGRSRACWAWHL
jgi:hypothetical protein